MSESNENLNDGWDDDELTEWTDDQFRRAAIYHGNQLIRPAQGTLTKRGRPKLDNPKRQVTIRLDDAVIEGFRAQGAGWQSRVNAELRKALGI
jgi:uncharacterized protein (DUF4415 family)